jgi:hypothetical protein
MGAAAAETAEAAKPRAPMKAMIAKRISEFLSLALFWRTTIHCKC